MNHIGNQNSHSVDVCVIGGGMSGLCAAVAAARHGAKVVLMHDRPVLGGNASSEIRMWIRGAKGKENRETGILQEIELENIYRNPTMNYSIWDTVLYQMVINEENITLLLNCSCLSCEMKDGNVASVTGWQLNSYTFHTVEAKLFIDSSGDSILAPLSGAAYRVGREGQAEFDEYGAPETADPYTMGSTCLIEARETDHYSEFIAPEWAYVYPDDESMHLKQHDIKGTGINFWWIELGGTQDTIKDAQDINHELIKTAYGIWDHIKNRGDHGMDNWELEWIGFLPGKRESRRYVGDYILTQNDIEQHPVFEDEVAYGGWQIDNHLPGGFFMSGKDGNHLQKRRLKEPYGIPLRCLYSKNIENLMFAGRNISATHIGFASTRVMATVGVIGQGVGTAASVAIKNGMTPRQVCQEKIREIQAILMEDDCFLPYHRREISALSKAAKLSCDYGDCSAIHNGLDRRIWGNDNGYYGRINQAVTYTFEEPTHISQFRLVVDSDLDREYVDGNPDAVNISTVLFKPLSYNRTSFGFPRCMIKSFVIEALDEQGEWQTVYETAENYQRFIRGDLDVTTRAIRFVPLSTYASEMVSDTYGSATAHIFAFEVR